MAGVSQLAAQHNIPLQPQGPGLVFHAAMLKPGAEKGPITSYRDYAAARTPHAGRTCAAASSKKASAPSNAACGSSASRTRRPTSTRR
jgi:hypothetical protein